MTGPAHTLPEVSDPGEAIGQAGPVLVALLLLVVLLATGPAVYRRAQRTTQPPGCGFPHIAGALLSLVVLVLLVVIAG